MCVICTVRRKAAVQDSVSRLTPLWMACFHGRVEVVRTLLASGLADLSLRDRGRRTAVDIATFRGHTEIVRMLQEAEAQAAVQEDP